VFSTKSEARKYAKEKLKALFLLDISEKITDKILNWDLWQKANSILFYSALPDEINLEYLIQKSLELHKKCFLPVISGDILKYSELNNSSELKQNNFSVLEVINKTIYSDFSQLDLIFIPGLMFDSSRLRLGRGKGFYDKTLREYNKNQTTTVGIISSELVYPGNFSFIENWDLKVNYLITEQE